MNYFLKPFISCGVALSYARHVEDQSFLRSTFSFIDEQDRVYYAEAPVRKAELQESELSTHLRPVNDECIYPKAQSSFTIALRSKYRDCYLKRPKLALFSPSEDDVTVPTLLREEAETMEFLRKRPHPNIARYHGCSVRRGYVVGLLLERHEATLEDAIKANEDNHDKVKWIADIESGIEHLHTLGLAHNDLNPTNIMIDKHGRAIIIDFGSCKPFGAMLITAGTPGWVDDEDFATSERSHDEIALKKLKTWLNTDRTTLASSCL
ncbi:kinase-like domain-containing protein [Elsinoe ampelina]|uniref:Kinase-like domain-containing protein n=1 Tax=Elsinoe ampelina TaxID=302913 RepID=A0A6A6GGV9_9PEZI|nr:kinase-like domain-containing protein [Elsinoe ampelina]